MRLSTSLLVLPALCSAASAADARVYVYEYSKHTIRGERRIEADTLSPIAARSLLAQRAGVEDFHTPDIYQPDSVKAINDYGLQSDLFSSSSLPKQSFLLVETDDELPSPSFSFRLSPAPSANDTLQLLDDLLLQSHTPNGRANLGAKFPPSELPATFKIAKSMRDDLIVITIPISNPSTAKNSWGTYSSPPVLHSLPATKVRRQETQTSPLAGIFPTCFPSRSSCESLTRNCTAHGACTLKYSDPSRNDQSPAKNCWVCACEPQKKTDSEGRVSTKYYGGPACQKKDVSVEFWLIVLFSVGLVGLVSFAIGSVWSMGDEALPSVIGAGVSGPTPRR